MQVEENAQSLPAHPANRRAHPRFAVDEDSVVLLVDQGLPLQCRILDLSLEGCRVRARNRLTASPRARVEITFKINGIAFRFSGFAQWTDGRQEAGIRFVEVPARRRSDLAEVLAEVEVAEAAKAAKEAAERLEAERVAPQAAAPEPSRPAMVPAAAPQPIAQPQPVAAPLPAVPPKQAPSERRSHARCAVDTSATILLVKIGSRIEGRILDLSLGGCRIRTHERFPVGIYTRVETEFHLEGLPFRLGGVVQAIHNRLQIGIRFLDMSNRKQQQVSEMMDEIARSRVEQIPPATV